jgi:azobenzene reductase
MKILILVGSGDVQSHSLGLGQAIAEQLKSLDVKSELVNLQEYKLPLYDRKIERSDMYDKKIKSFLQKSYSADGFVWITPIYHNSYSSVLKNALDWQHTKFPGKVVGLASHGGDRSPQALDQLMIVARAQHLISTRVRVATQASDYNHELRLTSPAILERVADFARELVGLTAGIGLVKV